MSQQPLGFEAVLSVITRPEGEPGPDAATYHPPSDAEDTRAALDRVRALHEDGGGWCCGDHGQEGALWPCPTIRAIDGTAS